MLSVKFSVTLLLAGFIIFDQQPLLAQQLQDSQTVYLRTDMHEVLQRSIVPAVLIAGSAVTWRFRNDFRDLRNHYTPGFRHNFDDYLQYAPAALAFSLKAGEGKGNYEMKRAVASYVISGIIMASVINTLKYTCRVERPDGSGRNAFPSGHTSNAFMNATFLHLEYRDRSLLYSIGGYTAATATGIGRLLNNRHWAPDVLAGAAIGILSAELGNYLAWKLFKAHRKTLGVAY